MLRSTNREEGVGTRPRSRTRGGVPARAGIGRRGVLLLGVIGAGACGDDGDSSGTASGSASATDGQTTAMETSAEATAPGSESAGSGEDAESTLETTATGSSMDGSTGSAGSTSDSDSEGGRGGGTIDVRLTGCDVDLGGTVVVSYNGSLGVASVYDNGATLTGSFQFDLDGTGVYALSSQHRVDTGTVVNLVDIAQGTWTNLDSDALSGGIDTIGGTLTVDTWDPASGISDLHFDDVSLLNTSSGNVCTINGTIVTTELYP